MGTFRRFDPYAELAKYQPQTLATLAVLAGAASDSENREEAPAIPDSISADQNPCRGGPAAKVAKPAKAFEPDAAASSGEAEEERAAIIEPDGGILRAWAEGFARLDPDRPRADVPLRRWQRFVDDVGIFLDRWAAYAAALGWGPYDLFGCDCDRPFARIDQAGLLWLLCGDKLVALTENTATIERRTGAHQTYRRRPAELGRVLAWELSRDG
jgi:hypothetical protein